MCDYFYSLFCYKKPDIKTRHYTYTPMNDAQMFDLLERMCKVINRTPYLPKKKYPSQCLNQYVTVKKK